MKFVNDDENKCGIFFYTTSPVPGNVHFNTFIIYIHSVIRVINYINYIFGIQAV